MADAVQAFWQDMDQEPADEFLSCERHGGMPPGVIDTVILDAEGDAGLIEPDQVTVGYHDAVGVARQVGQHRFGPGEGFLGVDNPVELAQRAQKGTECVGVGKFCMIAEELQLPSLVQLGQSFKEQASDRRSTQDQILL